ncbi:MAG: carboxypeptidase regulatory-like domain-containing protein [Pirellulaceae bacterium]|nr:carboxypeptidase regulatory-like domain-containing protein [Pirellulaceae bacterium]
MRYGFRLLTEQKLYSLRILSLIWVLSLTGCGSSLVEVSGTVSVDGKPTPGVNLRFYPQGTQADAAPSSTTSDEGGSFSLTTNMEPGLPKGSYKVTADWPDPKHKAKQVGIYSEPDSPRDLLKGKYASSSDIVFEITGPTKELKVDLTTSK